VRRLGGEGMTDGFPNGTSSNLSCPLAASLSSMGSVQTWGSATMVLLASCLLGLTLTWVAPGL
jgi:hypothetical protein